MFNLFRSYYMTPRCNPSRRNSVNHQHKSFSGKPFIYAFDPNIFIAKHKLKYIDSNRKLKRVYALKLS